MSQKTPRIHFHRDAYYYSWLASVKKKKNYFLLSFNFSDKKNKNLHPKAEIIKQLTVKNEERDCRGVSRGTVTTQREKRGNAH